MRKAFREWKDLGLGLEFTEVSDRSEPEVRIAFDQSDGSWSYVGRDVLGISASEPTMNFGWDLTDDYGHTTALLCSCGHATYYRRWCNESLGRPFHMRQRHRRRTY